MSCFCSFTPVEVYTINDKDLQKMSGLEVLNEFASAKVQSAFSKMSDIPIDRPYKIMNLIHISTKYGPAITVHLDDGKKICLPKRMTHLFTQDTINNLMEGKGSTITYTGAITTEVGEFPVHTFRFDRIE